MKTTNFANKGLATAAMNRANKAAGYTKYVLLLGPGTFDLFDTDTVPAVKAAKASPTTRVDFKVLKETAKYFVVEGSTKPEYVEKASLRDYAVNAFNILSATVTAKYAKYKLGL